MASGQYQNVNGVKTLSLHGKNYVEVAERVHMVHEKKAVFSIVKSEPVNVADRWLWVAVIVVDGQQYIGNAEIKMNAPKNTPDGTNPFECGETSAIGRALAFAGFGSVESIASKDEIERGKPFAGTETQEANNNKPESATPAARPAPAKPAQAAPVENKPAQAAPTSEQPHSDARPVSLDSLIAVANKRYPNGWTALKAEIGKKFKVIGDVSDELVAKDYNIDAQALIKEAMKKQPVTKAS